MIQMSEVKGEALRIQRSGQRFYSLRSADLFRSSEENIKVCVELMSKSENTIKARMWKYSSPEHLQAVLLATGISVIA